MSRDFFFSVAIFRLSGFLTDELFQMNLEFIDFLVVDLVLVLEEVGIFHLFLLNCLARVFDLLDLVKNNSDTTLPFIGILIGVEFLMSIVNEMKITLLIAESSPNHKVLHLIQDLQLSFEMGSIKRSHHIIVCVGQNGNEKVHDCDIDQHRVQDVNAPLQIVKITSIGVFTQDYLIPVSS